MRESKAPLVSIITPTWNRRELLRECIKSVQEQTLTDWEHLIIDDGSNDGTAAMVAEVTADDPRVQYLTRGGDPRGANVCRNQGIRKSRSPYLIFLDSDDLLASECLAHRVEIMRRNEDLDFAVFGAHLFFDNPEKPYGLWHSQSPGDDLNRFLQHECIWQTTGPIWRRSAFEKFGIFDESLLSMQDFDLHIRVIASGAQYLKFQQPDYYIRGHAFDAKTSSRHFTDPAFLLGVRNLPLRFHEILLTNHLLTWTRRRLLAGLVFANAENWTRIGNLREARTTWRTALDADLAETRIYLLGLVALTLLRIAPRDGGLAQRAVAKWKGLARFRQDPSLIKSQRKDS